MAIKRSQSSPWALSSLENAGVHPSVSTPTALVAASSAAMGTDASSSRGRQGPARGGRSRRTAGSSSRRRGGLKRVSKSSANLSAMDSKQKTKERWVLLFSVSNSSTLPLFRTLCQVATESCGFSNQQKEEETVCARSRSQGVLKFQGLGLCLVVLSLAYCRSRS